MRLSSAVRLTLAFLLLGCVIAYTQMGSKPAKLDTIKLKDDLFVIHNNIVPGNTTALITDEGVILVDDKFEVDHDGILAELKKITSKPVKYVINTHHHADHSGGNAKMQAMNVQIVSSEQARANMAKGKQPGLPNLAVDKHASLFLGGKEVQLYQIGRGHTNGDMVAYLPAHKTLVMGDLYTVGDETPILIDYAGGGSLKAWPATIDAALKMEYDTVIPGHGNVSNKKELTAFRDNAIKMSKDIHDMVASKKSRDQIAQALKANYHWADIQMMFSLDGAIKEMQ